MIDESEPTARQLRFARPVKHGSCDASQLLRSCKELNRAKMATPGKDRNVLKASLKGIRRASGFMYAKIALTAPSALDNIHVETRSGDGAWLPCWWHAADSKNEAKGNRIIIVKLALLEEGLQAIVIGARCGTDVQTDCVTVSMERAKWESRLNYRLKPALIEELQDVDGDDGSPEDSIAISIDYSTPHEDELFIRARCTAKTPIGQEIELRAFSPNGAEYPSSSTFMGQRKIESDPLSSDNTFEARFSLRVPGYPTSITVAACERDEGRDKRKERDVSEPANASERDEYDERSYAENHAAALLRGFKTFEEDELSAAYDRGRWVWVSADVDPGYHDWFCAHRATREDLDRQRALHIENPTTFSIVTPLFHTPLNLFAELVDSVRAQSYEHWELVLVNASPEDADLASAIEDALKQDERIACVTLPENLGIAKNTARGIAESSGEYVCFLDHDDLIEPDALYEYACEIARHPESDLIYCDEDKLSETGRYVEARFKPDFDIDLLRTNNYICHFLCASKRVLDEIDLKTQEYDGAQDYHMVLQIAERTSSIRHIAKVLYHWRIVEGSTSSVEQLEQGAKPQAQQASENALREHLKRLDLAAEVEPTRRPFVHHVRYHIVGAPLVSIVIPNKDCSSMLDSCVNSIIDKTTYGNYEIVIVENNSREPETLACYTNLQARDDRIQVVTWPGEFNFSKIVNFGARHTRGEYLLMLNNDTEVIEPRWLELMLGLCQRSDVGAVGAKLLYADDTIQHAGIVITDRFTGGHHVHACSDASSSGYFFQLDTTREYSAVTGACLITPRAVFNQVGGFEERLAIAYNDIDYCLKVGATGRKIVYEPQAELRHLESVSRGDDEKSTRLFREQTLLQHRWPELYCEGDPHFNRNLSSAQYALRW